jgi:hypothetical protein
MKTRRTAIINKVGYVSTAAALAIVLTACGEKKNKQEAEINTPEEIEQTKQETDDIADVYFSDVMTGKVFHTYQQIRMALVNSDAEGVQRAAGNLAESFSGERDEMKSIAMAMAEADDIEKQRELFSVFTANVAPMFKDALSEGTIYKQFCPMAFEGNGGYWISNTEEIRNPYYGERMLKCGKVTETINK